MYMVSDKDRKHLKDLVTFFGDEETKRVASYFIENCRSYINGPPSIAAFYGWRNKVFADAAAGSKSKKKEGTDESIDFGWEE